MILGASTELPAPVWLPFAILAGFALIFPLFWCFVVLLISRIGSWHTLSKIYPAGTRAPKGEKHEGVVGRVGAANYKFVLTVTIAPDGFFLEVMALFRPGHPPLFIPWSAVTHREVLRVLRWDMISLRIGSPKVATIALALPGKLFDLTA